MYVVCVSVVCVYVVCVGCVCMCVPIYMYTLYTGPPAGGQTHCLRAVTFGA